ncbi:MAG TPA: AIR synthase related protein, partial [Edaphobacter sp.]|nr:AIR synthase related protein [Edaphobacter sp.]
ITQSGVLVADIPNQSLTDDAPLYHRPVGVWKAPVPMDPPAWVLEELKKPRDYTADLKKLLASANICDKRWVFEQYDSMVQTNTVQGPGGEAGVMRIKGTGSREEGVGSRRRERGLAMALAGNGRWCYLDPKLGAMHGVAEAARKVACTGATPVAATNCLNFGNPEKPEIMAQLSQAIDGIAEACNALGTPVTGGNVSLYNETKGEGIYPTPVLGVVGILEDVTRSVPASFQHAGDDVLLLIFAKHNSQENESNTYRELGSSEFAKTCVGSLWGSPPSLSLKDEANLQQCLIELGKAGLLHSACDVSDGGIFVALAKAAIGEGIGFRDSMANADSSENFLADAYWREESSTVVVSCAPTDTERVVAIAQKWEADGGAYKIGNTVENAFVLKPFFNMTVGDLSSAYSGALEAQLAAEVVTA